MMFGGTASSSRTSSPATNSTSRGSTSHMVMVRLIHLRIGGSVSLTQKTPSPFFLKKSSRSSYSLAISTVMVPSVTTVEHSPSTGTPHSSSRVARRRGTLNGVAQMVAISHLPSVGQPCVDGPDDDAEPPRKPAGSTSSSSPVPPLT